MCCFRRQVKMLLRKQATGTSRSQAAASCHGVCVFDVGSQDGRTDLVPAGGTETMTDPRAFAEAKRSKQTA